MLAATRVRRRDAGAPGVRDALRARTELPAPGAPPPETADQADAFKCPICQRGWPAAPMIICISCHSKMNNNIVAIMRLYRKLSVMPRRGAKDLNAGLGNAGFESRSPANDDAIVLRDPRSEVGSVLTTFHAWAEYIRDERNLVAGTAILSVEREGRVILTNLPWISRDVHVFDMSGEMFNLHRSIRAAMGDTSPRRPYKDPTLPVLISTKAIAARYGVPVASIRRWASVAQWTPYGNSRVRRWDDRQVQQTYRERQAKAAQEARQTGTDQA